MDTRILVSTDVSGGSLRQLIEDASSRFGVERLAVGAKRIAMDFPLPCHTGVGMEISEDRLSELRRRYAAQVFFSDSLCAKYFTYRADRTLHLVLFANW